MEAGTVSATCHGPAAELAVNQMPLATAKNWAGAVCMTGVAVFTAYDNEVLAMPANFGAPSYTTFSVVDLRDTVAVCGMVAAMAASFACGVPGTDTSAFACASSGAIFANSGGKLFPSTHDHGPFRPAALNQRPDSSR